MRFAFIDAWKEEWPVEFLCKVMRVTSRGFRAWRVRPMSQRQRDDMVILAHIREQRKRYQGSILASLARIMVSAALVSTPIAPKLSRSFMFWLFWNVRMP